MTEIWLRQNNRAIIAGMIPPGVAALLLVTYLLGAFGDPPQGVLRVAVVICAALAIGLVGLLAFQLGQPRLAYREGKLLVNLRAGHPIAVPIEVVEAFLLGMGPAMLPGKRNDRTEARVLTIRIAERAEEWANAEVKPALGKWCGGYIAIRGTWCEPLSIALVNRLNARLGEVQRAARVSHPQGAA
jgi:hypothetical protein